MMLPRPTAAFQGCLALIVCWLVDRTTSAPISQSVSRQHVSLLTCHSFREKYVDINVEHRTRILSECNVDDLSWKEKLQCHKIHMKYFGNATYPQIIQPVNTTHVRCEWRFRLPVDGDEQLSARLFVVNKNWARRGPGEHGCSKRDGRLVIIARNASGRTFTEKERFCGRLHSLPSQRVKKFYPETVSVTLSYRTHVENSTPGPFGYFFTFPEGEMLGGCAFGCDHSGGEGYDRCDNVTGLPSFLRIPVDESRARLYSSSEIIKGLTVGARFRNQRSPDFHCIDRYPIFKQLFRLGEIPDPRAPVVDQPPATDQPLVNNDINNKVEFRNGNSVNSQSLL